MQGEARLRGLTHAVGLMEPVFALCRRAGVLGYTGQSPPARAVADYLLKDHKPSAMQGEARLRGLTHAVGLMEPVFALCRRAEALGYTGQSPPARAIPDLILKDHKPSGRRGEARLRGTRTPTVTLSVISYQLSAIGYRLSAIGYQLSKAQPACTG